MNPDKHWKRIRQPDKDDWYRSHGHNTVKVSIPRRIHAVVSAFAAKQGLYKYEAYSELILSHPKLALEIEEIKENEQEEGDAEKNI